MNINISRYLRVFWLSFLCFILNIPYGPDAPSRSELLSCSLDNAPIICEIVDGEPTGSFTLHYKEAYRPITLQGNDLDHNYFWMKIFKVDEDDDVDFDDINFHPLYDDDYPGLKIDYYFEVEGDPILIREGDEFTVIVHFTLSPKAKPGTYHLVFDFYNDGAYDPRIYKDAVIIP